MFVRVNKVDEIPDDSGGKGGWWTVEPDIPDEGRPGRKTKSKKRGPLTPNGTGMGMAIGAVDGKSVDGSIVGSVGEDEKTGGKRKTTRESSLVSTKSGKGSLRLSNATMVNNGLITQ